MPSAKYFPGFRDLMSYLLEFAQVPHSISLLFRSMVLPKKKLQMASDAKGAKHLFINIKSTIKIEERNLTTELLRKKSNVLFPKERWHQKI